MVIQTINRKSKKEQFLDHTPLKESNPTEIKQRNSEKSTGSKPKQQKQICCWKRENRGLQKIEEIQLKKIITFTKHEEK